MDVEIIGNNESAQQILKLTKSWDQAVAHQLVDELVSGYTDNIEIFDIGSQLIGQDKVKTLWQSCFPYFGKNPKVYRTKVKLYAGENAAFMHCYSKICGDQQDDHDKSPWCRTTVCFYKDNDEWKAVHEHISMPIDFEKGVPALIFEVP